MHQHTDIGNIIGVIACNLEVIDVNGAFQYLVLDFLDNDILAIDENQNVARTKLCRIRPTLDWRIEGMGGCGDDLLTANEDMDKLRCLIDIGFCDSSERLFASLFIPCPDIIADHNVLDGFPAFIDQNDCSRGET